MVPGAKYFNQVILAADRSNIIQAHIFYEPPYITNNLSGAMKIAGDTHLIPNVGPI